jgi:hypothetical protein
MKKHKHFILQLPEYYLIILSILAAYSLPISLKPIAIVPMVILSLQIIFKNRTLGHIIASLFLIGNLFALYAFTSGLNEIPRFNTNAQELIFGGFILFGFNLLVSWLMLFKYPIKSETPRLQTES